MSKAVTLYVDACRLAMSLDLRDFASWTELSRCLPAARQALMCCVCGRLLEDAAGPAQSVCQHYVCRACVGGKTRYMKGGCGWCKDAGEFVSNAQLSTLVRCFRQLCVYLNGFVSFVPAKGGPEVETLVAIIREGITKKAGEVVSPEPLTIAVVDDELKQEVNTPAAELELQDSASTVTCRSSPKRSAVERRCAERRSAKNGCTIHNRGEPYRKRPRMNVRAAKNRAVHSRVRVSDGLLPNNDVDVIGGSFDGAQFDSSCWSVDAVIASPDSSHQNIAIEETILGHPYDPRWSLLENSVLAEHDYNKFSTAGEDADSLNITPVAVAQSSKSQRTGSSAPRRSTTKRSGSSRTTSARKQSLTIRQLSEGSSVLSSSHSGKRTEIGDASAFDVSAPRRQKSSVPKVKVGCRCAMATPAPGKLTCCGQRCPCYAAFHGCSTSCKCRGCRNPRGDPVQPLAVVTTIKVSGGDIQDSLPVSGLFDSGGCVFTTHEPVVTRFSPEPISCYGSV